MYITENMVILCPRIPLGTYPPPSHYNYIRDYTIYLSNVILI